MDIRRLEIFLKLFETGSFSKTAQFLGLSQPSVSTSIKALEDSLGQKLFNRSPRAVSPLEAAKILAPFATEIIQTAGRAAWAISRTLPPGETLLLGASSVPAQTFLPPALAEFNKKYPNIQIKLKRAHSQDIFNKILAGELDMGLTGLNPTSDSSIKSAKIGSDGFILLSSQDLAQAMKKAPASAAELLAWPLILREDGSGTRQAIMEALASNLEADILNKLNIKAEIEGFSSSVAMVKASLGASIISSLLLPSINMEGLVAYKLQFLAKRSFFLLRKADSPASPALDALANILTKDKSDK